MSRFFPSYNSLKNNARAFGAATMGYTVSTGTATLITKAIAYAIYSDSALDEAEAQECRFDFKIFQQSGFPCDNKCLELCVTLLENVEHNSSTATWIAFAIAVGGGAAILIRALYNLKRSELAAATEPDFVDLNEESPLKP